jgi:dephospho-CoA kinase
MKKPIIGIAGLPASGKTTVGEIIATKLSYELVELSDITKDIAEQDLGPDPTGEQLRMWTERNLLGDDRSQLYERTIEYIKPLRTGVVISGLRTYHDKVSLIRSDGKTALFYVDADFDVRYDRILERGRKDEEEYAPADLLRRDRREKSWGTNKLQSHADRTIRNEFDEHMLKGEVKEVLEETNFTRSRREESRSEPELRSERIDPFVDTGAHTPTEYIATDVGIDVGEPDLEAQEREEGAGVSQLRANLTVPSITVNGEVSRRLSKLQTALQSTIQND